jgi:hypothetical protein
MDGDLVPVGSNSTIHGSLENFTLDAERWLAALYCCVRTNYGDDAAHGAAECWLRVFEERLQGSSDLPELTRITAAAIVLFVSDHRQTVCTSLVRLHNGGTLPTAISWDKSESQEPVRLDCCS